MISNIKYRQLNLYPIYHEPDRRPDTISKKIAKWIYGSKPKEAEKNTSHLRQRVL